MFVVLRFVRLCGGRLAAYGRCEYLRVRQGHEFAAGVEPQVGNSYLRYGALERAIERP